MNSAIADSTRNITSPAPFSLRPPSGISQGTSQLQHLCSSIPPSRIVQGTRLLVRPFHEGLHRECCLHGAPQLQHKESASSGAFFNNSGIADCTRSLTSPAPFPSRPLSQISHGALQLHLFSCIPRWRIAQGTLFPLRSPSRNSHGASQLQHPLS